jgi:hypothetical protein
MKHKAFPGSPSRGGPEPTLCLPDLEKSCFACCPPIRPAGYEHVQYRTILQRILRENTRGCNEEGGSIRPITGFSCWAMGYLDPSFRRAGCLLHPARHGGNDLRYRVDYAGKCSRENCPESTTFQKLPVGTRRFWLHLADGLDTFRYSSRWFNPLFKLMGWGPGLLERIAAEKEGQKINRIDFFLDHPVLNGFPDPRSHAYLLTRIVQQDRIHRLQSRAFARSFQAFSSRLMAGFRGFRTEDDAPHTHLLGLDPQFLAFLRLGPGIRKIHEETAKVLKEETDHCLDGFINLMGESDQIPYRSALLQSRLR